MVTQASTVVGNTWLSIEQRPALTRLWQLCEDNAEAGLRLAQRTLGHVAALAGAEPGRLALMLSPQTLTQALKTALTEDAQLLTHQVETCGLALAREGVDLHDAFSLVEGVQREVGHWIVARYAREPSSIVEQFAALDHVCNRMLETLARAFVSHREQLLDEQKRSTSKALLWSKRLSESGLLGILVCDVHGGIKDANQTFAEMVGYSREELTSGKVRWSEMTPHEWAALDEDAVAQLAASGRTRPWEKEYYRKDGSRVPILVGVATLSGDEVIAFTLDISERKRSEALRVRSQELEIENLRIQEASRLKSEFLANMSHELRTPLNSIIGFADLLHDDEIAPDSPEHREFLGDILKSGRHLLQLINDVLDLAKIEAGKMDFRPERVELSRLITEVLDVLRSIAGTSRISIKCHVAPEANDVVTDPARLKQVLYNFLSNALKFTPTGGNVAVRVLPQGSDQVTIEVEDDGPGISEQDLGRLFVEFEQLDHGRAKKHPGTGLGLALTKRIVEAQGGTVGVRSKKEHGSTFWATLPRLATVSSERLPAVLPERYDDAAIVLVVEDDPNDQQNIVRALNGAGYGVEVASTGKQATEACRERAYDAITLDILLPDMSGLQVLRELRTTGVNQDTPVIVVSVVAEHQVIQGFSVYDYVAKPVDSSKLLGSLERAGVTPEKPGAILVVDDDPSSLKLMRTTLHKLGYNVECQPDGARALECARKQRHSAVILDLLMPGMDGFEFLRRFRSEADYREIPVIVWTTKDLTTEDYRRLKLNAQAVFAKGNGRPLSLIEELKVLLGERAGNAGEMAP